MKRFQYFYVALSISFFSCINESSKSENIKSDYQHLLTNENKQLEEEYAEMLKPILHLKSEKPKIYWFIVSWLKTQYKTPNWKNYNSKDWKVKTKQRGIDCSGFARVMQQNIFNKKVRGSSRGILKEYCKAIDIDDLQIGDLVFFKAPNAHNPRIVHVGVYLENGYFVHATSKKSAAIGLGLNISSLNEKRWKQTFVSGGEIK